MRNLELVSIAWLVVLLPLAIANKTPDHPKEDCIRKCGNVSIDYPFGISKDCYLNEAFEVSCINDVLTLAKSDIEHKFSISAIRFPDQVLLLSNQIMARDCNDESIDTDNRQSNVSFVLGEPFKVSSSANRFRALGCSPTAFLVNDDWDFRSQCGTQWKINSAGAKKSGWQGGCQIPLSYDSSGYNYSVTDMFNYTDSACWRRCSYVVLAEEGYNISNEVLDRFLNNQIPLVAKWAIQDGHCNETGRSFTCGQNAWCNHTWNESGYHCFCNSDGKGNPYLNGPDGCQTGGGLAVDKPKMKKLILGAVAGVAILFLTCSFFICLSRKLPSDSAIFFWRKKTHDSRNVEAFLENYDSVVPKRYRYSELKKMTNSFKDNLGQGGYGSVFKGKLNDGRLVAVKVLNNSKGGNGEEFINEVASIGRTYHVNVVALLGFCSEGSKRALVYEFMPKGSLEKFIYPDKLGVRHALDCQKLFQLALHGDWSTYIVVATLVLYILTLSLITFFSMMTFLQRFQILG